jgi:peptidoglycan/xylan/chitin deacetylase (PgdA/CDA1 family)
VGLLPLLERFASRPLLVVLNYHRVMRPSDSRYDPNTIEATPDEFDAQMSMLRKKYAVANPDELRELIAQPSKVRRLRVAITFDDGYRDNYTDAFPILKSHGIAATFFLPTQFVGTRHLPWWDQIAYVVRHSKTSEIKLTYPRPATVTVDREHPGPAIQAVLRLFKDPTVEQAKFLEELERACGLGVPAQAEDRQFLTWEEADEMARAGMAIASHTHNHRILSQLAADEQREELTRSRDELKTRSFDHADCLAYPVGNTDSFSAETRQYAKEAGYKFAFSNYGGINHPDKMDALDVRRLGMGLEENARQLRTRLALTGLTQRQVW